MNPRTTVRYVPPIVAIAISVGLFTYGMTRPHQEAYSFPNLFVGAMIVFSILWLVNAITEKSMELTEPEPMFSHWREVGWGVAITVIYLAIARWLGFLVSSWVLFVTVGIGYNPKAKSLKGVLVTVVAATLFLAVIYGLFNALLQVQTPEGLL